MGLSYKLIIFAGILIIACDIMLFVISSKGIIGHIGITIKKLIVNAKTKKDNKNLLISINHIDWFIVFCLIDIFNGYEAGEHCKELANEYFTKRPKINKTPMYSIASISIPNCIIKPDYNYISKSKRKELELIMCEEKFIRMLKRFDELAKTKIGVIKTPESYIKLLNMLNSDTGEMIMYILYNEAMYGKFNSILSL